VNPSSLKYHKEHDWAKIEGDIATFGLTDYAQEALGDIVYIELPEVGTEVTANAAYAELADEYRLIRELLAARMKANREDHCPCRKRLSVMRLCDALSWC